MAYHKANSWIALSRMLYSSPRAFKAHQSRREYAIIGRDILDRVVLHLDGPGHEFYVDIAAGPG